MPIDAGLLRSVALPLLAGVERALGAAARRPLILLNGPVGAAAGGAGGGAWLPAGGALHR
jgi:hypothetical protein